MANTKKIKTLKILVTTDFSLVARHALEYALNYSNHLNAEFTLLHVDNSARPSFSFSSKLDAIIEGDDKKRLSDLANSVRTDLGLDFNILLTESRGDTAIEIVAYAEKHGIDLIIMGAKGQGLIQSKIFGSVASKVMEKAPCPVLLVPAKAEIKEPQDIVYASDLTNIEEEIRHIIPFAKRFEATIHTVHIYPEVIDASSFDEERAVLNRIAQTEYDKINFNAVMDFDIIRGLDRYVKQVDTDLLAMYTHKSSILEFLFNESYSKEMALHNEVPLLVMAKTMDTDLAS